MSRNALLYFLLSLSIFCLLAAPGPAQQQAPAPPAPQTPSAQQAPAAPAQQAPASQQSSAGQSPATAAAKEASPSNEDLQKTAQKIFTAGSEPAAVTPAGGQAAAAKKEKAAEEEAPPGEAPVEKREIDKKPPKYGAYIYRDDKFIRLPQVPVSYSGVWFPISLTTKKIAACYVAEKDAKDLPVFQEGDLLALHFKGADRMKWYYYPLTRFAQCSFPGNNEAELWQRPEGFYAGFVAIGNPRSLHQLFRKDYEDGYRFEQRRIRDDDIVYKDKTIVFARVSPVAGLSVSRFAVTGQSVSFTDSANYQDLLRQLPEDAALFRFGPVEAEDNFEGKRDWIERFNEDISVRYMVTKKEFVLQKDKILETGIFVKHPNFIRFASDGDFDLIMREREWTHEKGWMPAEEPFGNEPEPVPLTDMMAYRVRYRNFALRFENTLAQNQVRLMGLSNGTRVTMYYSPLYDYEEDYQENVRAGLKFLQEKNYAQAEAEFNKALEKLPEYPEAQNGLARLYATATDKAFFKPGKATELAIAAARFKPVEPQILHTLSLALYVNGDLARSLETLKLACGHSDVQAYSNYCKQTEERYEEIKDLMDKARKAQEDGDPEEAIKDLHFALEKMPNNFAAMDRLAWLYCTVDDPDIRDKELGLELAKNAYAIAKNRASILDTLAEAFYRNGHKDDALAASKRALYWEPYSEYFISRRNFFAERK
ncbi:MAG: hypothetical protein AB1921_13880 [Thermodesulfobacteriota bacterium]